MPATKPDRTFWQRITDPVRRLLPRTWRGESVGIDDPGYPVHPLDLYDGIKGIEHSLLTLVAAWRKRRPGGDSPASQTLSDANVRDLARLLERYNPFAQAMLTALRSYTLADQGMAVELQVREGVDPTPDDESLLADATAFLNGFIDREDWWSREREWYNRCHRDGEGTLRFFAGPDGVRVRFVEPEWIVNPDGSAEWAEGIRNAPDDAEVAEAIWVQTRPTPADGEEVLAGEFYMVKCNVDKCLRRGLSDFASSAKLITGALDCLAAMIGAEGIRQGVVMITQHEASAPADLDAMIAGQTDYLDRAHKYSGAGGPSRDVPTQAVSYVREVHLTGAQKFAAMPQGNVGDGVNAVNTALLSAASRYHMPLWVISGDASRNNALDLQAEGPFGRFIADEQAWYSRHVRNALWRVLEIGVELGLVKPEALDALDLTVTPQRPTEQRDPTRETDRNKTLYDSGLMGKPTWAAREGLDFDGEQDDLERYGGPPKMPEKAMPAGWREVKSEPETTPVVSPETTPVVSPETTATITAPASDATAALRGSIGGSAALLDLQKSVYSGAMPREAAVANAKIVFGFSEADAEGLFPQIAPVATADVPGPATQGVP